MPVRVFVGLPPSLLVLELGCMVAILVSSSILPRWTRNMANDHFPTNRISSSHMKISDDEKLVCRSLSPNDPSFCPQGSFLAEMVSQRPFQLPGFEFGEVTKGQSDNSWRYTSNPW